MKTYPIGSPEHLELIGRRLIVAGAAITAVAVVSAATRALKNRPAILESLKEAPEKVSRITRKAK